MKEHIPINMTSGKPTVFARDLHDFLEVETPYHKWFPRMCEYGFTENQDFAVTDIFVPNPAGGPQSQKDAALTNFRETAKQLSVPPRRFVQFLLERKFIYRDKRGKLLPYEDKNDGLFEVKECLNEKTQWSGTQTLVTPKGRETFRLLYVA